MGCQSARDRRTNRTPSAEALERRMEDAEDPKSEVVVCVLPMDIECDGERTHHPLRSLSMILCKLNFHNWQGCRCTRCHTTRDADHNWQGCECARCGAEQHDWKGCRCSGCGAEQHDWKGCRCTRCHTTRDAEHIWKGCKCSKCGSCPESVISVRRAAATARSSDRWPR